MSLTATPETPARRAAPAAPPLVEALVSRHGATWVDLANVADWAAGPGDRVLFFHGDPIRFPECLDVAVVLPELQRHFGGRFVAGVVRREDEDAIAARYAVQRWPSLVFLRGGQYVGLVAGMLDWDVYLQQVGALLAAPPSRVPGVGIPVVAAGASAASDRSCH